MTGVGVVIPVGPKREKNLTAVLRSLEAQTRPPEEVVLVYDGHWPEEDPETTLPMMAVKAFKHEPGREQPRNLGVRALRRHGPAVSHVAFLDTDVIVHPAWLDNYLYEMKVGGERGFYYGPYEFLPQGVTGTPVERRVEYDSRWPMFEAHETGTRYVGDLSKGLGAYSGNLLWNIEDFTRVGGFWNELHHGRCEDGELGLRAAHMGIPMGLSPESRGWHQWHPINVPWVLSTNAIDVPKIKERHPWLELGEGGMEVFAVDEDGKRFNVRCDKCDWEGNTALIWQHQEEAHGEDR